MNRDSTQVTALAYQFNGKTEIRVYYIDSNSQLAELCTHETDTGTGLSEWTDGTLNGKFSVDSKTMLTSSVDFNENGQLKVYYQKQLAGFMWCTFVVTGATNWEQQEINSKWQL